MAKEFDKDLDEYLQARRKATIDIKGFFKKLIPEKRKIDVPEEVETYEEPRTPLLHKIFKKQEPINEELLQTKMQLDDTLTDIKEIAKITLGMIKELPDEQLRHFKQSDDFEKMKTILKKHELIK